MLKNSTMNFSRFIMCFALLILGSGSLFGQVSGTKTIPTDYATIAAFITDINTNGIGAGGVTLNVPSGYTETAPAGGFAITATGTAANPIIIQGTGGAPKPILTASNALTAGNLNDGIVKLIGSDYVTISGLDLRENAANTTTAAGTNNMTEWGIALLYTSATNGAQHNLLSGNTITLNRAYTNTFGIYSNTRHTALNATTTADITAATGANSFNQVYGNAISNVNMGITFIGSNAAANQDSGNDIGGSSALTGNTITNWGGAGAVSSYVSNTGSSYCIFMNHQVGDNISYNTITSAAVSGTSVTFRGIVKDYTTTAPTGTFTSTISNNTITMSSGFTSGTFQNIASAGLTALSTATINITNNSLVNNVMSGASSSSAIVGINNSSAPGILNITGNTFTGWTSTATSGGVTAINNSGAVVTTINLNNNFLGTSGTGWVTFSAATSGGVNGILNTGGATTATLNINSNDIRGIVHSVAGSSSHIYFSNTAASPNTNINSNTFTNLNVNTTGSVSFIVNNATHAASTTHNVNNNSVVTGYVKGGSGGTILFYNSFSLSGSTVTEINTGNNFSNMTFTGATITGWRSADGSTSAPLGSRKTVSNNTFNNIVNNTSGAVQILYVGYSDQTFSGANAANNVITNITAAGNITGIFTDGGSQNFTSNTISGLNCSNASGQVVGIFVNASASGTNNVNVSLNTVSGITCSGATAPLIAGITVGAGTNVSVFRNKIYNVSATAAFTGLGAVNGILLQGGTLVNTNNNIIGQLTAPLANSADAIRGISVISSTTATNYNLNYNTIHLNATSSGANFGSSAIYHVVSATATTAALDMRNNIISNQSSSNGTGLTVAYRRSGTALNNYASTANRNNYAAPVIFNDGTNSDLTLGAYQTRVATRDANSLNVNPAFTSTVGGNAGFLHINTALPTTLESAGANIAGITTDYDGDTRQGNGGYTGTGTAPDIGADEFELAIINCSAANGGTISPASGTNCAGTTATITVTGATLENGITYQWKVSTTAGGPYANVSGGSGATTASYTTGALTAGTYYYVMETTCSFGSIVGLSNEYTLTVNPTPVVTINPSSATYCSPGGTAAALTANGASTYAWSPATGLSATTGATVNASPSATTTYSVVGTASGCTSAATPITVTVATMPVMASVTATPATVCNGSNSQLAAAASVSYNNTASVYTFAGSTGTYTAITGTTLGAAAIGDDAGIGNLPVGFTFPYNGTTFTVFGARSNGLIELGQATATLSGFSANSLSGTANCIAPLWDDNNTTGGSIIYATTGTAPNRVLTVQWTGMHVAGGGSSTNPTLDCQVRLYETTGVIEFVYGPTSAALSSPTASIGISGATGNYLSVTPLIPANTSTVSNSTENSVTSSANFPSGTIYTFTPPAAPVMTYSWSPATFLSSTSISNPVATAVTSPTSYTVTATTPGGCSVAGNVSLTLNPLPSAVTATNSAQCGAQIPTASIASTTGAPTPTFHWYDSPAGGALVQSSTSTTYTSTVSVTTTFYVSEVNGGTGCESNRTPVTVNVSSPDAILASVDNATICIGSSVNLTVVNTSGTPFQSYTYTWAGMAGSGVTSASGAAITATPTVPGTYTYNVTGVDGGCSAISSVNVTVNAFTVALSPVNVTCNGYNNGTFTQGAVSCGTAPYTYSIDGGAFVGTIPTNLTPGTHTVVVMNSLGFTSVSQNITITEPTTTISTPTGTGATVCQNASSAMVSASSLTNLLGSGSVTVVIPFNIATQPTELSATTVPTVAASPNVISTAVMAALPAGSVITSASLNYNGIQATASSWMSDVRLGLTGAATQAYTGGTGTTNAAGTFNYTAPVAPASINAAGGSISLHYFDFYNDNTSGSESTFPTGAGVANLTITYTPPVSATISWWNASTGGAQIGTGSPFQTVGTSVLPNTNTPGVYTVYAQGEYNSCSGLTRTPITVTVKPIPTSTTTVSACATYTWNGTTYNTSGTYTHTLVNSVGCDSIATLNLTIKNNTSATVVAAACNTYTWAINGATYTTSGTHTATIPNAAGCDSVITLNLTINTPTSATVSHSACVTYTWPLNGATYTTSGTHTATIMNAAGCDSVVTLNLTINQPTTGTDTQVACVSYTWINGVTYTASNNTATYTIVGGNAHGCDSVVTLNLTINQPTTGTDTQVECVSYTWINGVTYTASNNTATFTIVGGNANGCDSIVTLNLTINQPTTSTVPETECTSYTWAQNGMTYTASGMYNDTITNAAGCDSIITLNLTIIQPTTSSVSATACSSYTWAQNGMTYTASGAYTDTIPNSTGCDSVITLNLTINMPTSSVFTVSTCSPSYTWAQNGNVYNASGMYNDTIQNAAGCDSVVTLNLTITTFVATATDNGNATITASAGTTYQWINCATNTPIAGATAQTFAATANGSYSVIVSNGTCSDTSNCVNITNVGIKENTISTISVHPNPTHDVVIVTMDASSAVVEVMDVQGKLVQTTQIKSGDQVDLSAYERGVYTLRIKTELGTSIERIVKN